MELGGYSILGWAVGLAAFLGAGWITSYAVVWLLTLRHDNDDARSPNSPIIRFKWVLTLIFAVTYFIIAGTMIDWQFTRAG